MGRFPTYNKTSVPRGRSAGRSERGRSNRLLDLRILSHDSAVAHEVIVADDHLYDAIDRRLGDRLRAEGIKPLLLGQTWMEAAEREYTSLSISGRYKPYGEVFEALFYRILWMGGIQKPRAFTSPEDLEFIMREYEHLTMRPGAAECVQTLRDTGFTVWAFTAADLKRVGGYFQRAGIDLPPENLLSCDSTGVRKPDLAAYKPLLDKLVTEKDGKIPWFAAAHMWDVSAARAAGFKGAYCTVLELEPLYGLFGDLDVVDGTLPGMAEKIIAAHVAS